MRQCQTDPDSLLSPLPTTIRTLPHKDTLQTGSSSAGSSLRAALLRTGPTGHVESVIYVGVDIGTVRLVIAIR